jgi:predicted acetyltransferase
LKLILDKAKLANLKRVLLTVDEGNIASEKIIIANGGVCESSSYVDKVKKVVKRYWINL